MTSLKNTYFIMRHGQSTANATGLIVSDPKNGVSAYGLSEMGKQQVHEALSEARINYPSLSKKTIVVSSDFLRCRETAEIVQSQLECPPVETDPRLRERFFGQLELETSTGYELVWAEDQRHPKTGAFEAESVESVLARTLACIQSLEERFLRQTILLISHGDTLQILSTHFANLTPGDHRSIPGIQTAEIRLLSL